MKFNEIEPGEYKAKIKDYGTKAIVTGQGDKVYKAVVAMDINVGTQWVTGYWEGFWFTTKQEPNQRTIKTLLECGFKGRNPNALNLADALDMTKELYVTVIEKENTNSGKIYREIDWINSSPGGAGGISKESMVVDEDVFNDAFLKAQDSMANKIKPAEKAKPKAAQTAKEKAKQTAEQKAIEAENFPL